MTKEFSVLLEPVRVDPLHFVNSFQVLNRSLETFVDNLFKGRSNFQMFRQRFINRMKNIGIYLSQVDKFAKFNETWEADSYAQLM